MLRPERQTFRNEVQSPSAATVKASRPELPLTFTVQSDGGGLHEAEEAASTRRAPTDFGKCKQILAGERIQKFNARLL